MGAWSSNSKSQVAHMNGGDFRSNEKSVTIAKEGKVRIELVSKDGKVTILKEKIPVLPGEVVDGTVMHVRAVEQFWKSKLPMREVWVFCSRCISRRP